MKATNPRVRRLLDQAVSLGFTIDQKPDGNGHHVLRHPNGVMRVAATPGDYRGDRNAVLLMERISGRKLPRVNSGRSRGQGRTAGFTQTVRTPSARHWTSVIEELRAEHHDLVLELKVLAMGEATHAERNEALHCLRRLARIEEQLIELRQPLPEETSQTLALLGVS